MKTLVTGATGFIGTHLVKAFVEEGRDIRCLVRRTSNKSNLEKLGVELIYGDLLDKDSLKRAVKGVNVIYHLGGEVYSFKIKDYYKINVQGTKNLLDNCLSSKIEKFIYFGSIAAVGPNPDRNKLLTEDDPCNPITPYGRSKYEAEKIILESFRQFKIPIVIIRLPTVYGPGQSQVLINFFQKVRNGKFYIIGTGEYLRSLCYIENLIDGVLLAEEKPEAVGEIFFISDKNVYTFKEIVQTIAEVEDKKNSNRTITPIIAKLAMFIFNAFQKIFKLNILKLYTIGTMTINLGCDISKAENILSYNPKIDLREGVKKTSQYLKSVGDLI